MVSTAFVLCTFAAVFRRLCSIITFLVLSAVANAQSGRLTSEQGEPLEGALVVYSDLAGTRSFTAISDRRGEAALPDIEFPLVRRVILLGYQDHIDTLLRKPATAVVLKTAAQELGEVTITDAWQPGYQANTVQKVDVITRETIERKAAVNLSDLLSHELGIRSSSDAALGSSISMQGLGGEHVKILIDGVPVIGRKNGIIDLDQLNLANVERVEIVKGPMSVLYGTDALGGVINLITKKNKTKKFNGQLNGYYETTGVYNTDFNAGAGLGKSSVNISGGRNFFDGWSAHDTARFQQWKPKEQYFGDIRFQHTFKSTTVNFLSNYMQEEVFNKSNTIVTPYSAFANDQIYRTWRSSQQLNAEHKLNENSSLQFAGSYSYYKYIKNTWRKNMETLTQQLTPDTLDDDTTKFNAVFGRAVYNYNSMHSWSLITGAELNYEQASGGRIDGMVHNMTDIAVFASADLTYIRHLTVRPSVRAIHNSLFEAPLIPSVNVMYKATDAVTIRSSWSSGFRAPSLKELYLNFFDNGIHNVQGNTNLHAETSQNVIASVDYRKKLREVNIVLSPSVFYTDVRNRISLVQVDEVTGLYQYMNLDRFFSRGAEFKAHFSGDRTSFEAGYAYTGTNGSFEGEVSQPEIAWYNMVTASASYKIQKTSTVFSAFWKYLGQQPTYIINSKGNLELFTNEAYSLMDATVMQPLYKNMFNVTLGLRNIFDVQDVRAASNGGAHSGSSEATSLVGMGTSAFVKLTFNFR